MSVKDIFSSIEARIPVKRSQKQLILGVFVLIILIATGAVFGVYRLNTAQALEIEQQNTTSEPESELTVEEFAQAVESEPSYYCVYVSGSVVARGVYQLKEGSRVADAIEKAGGFLSDADTSAVNLARLVTDGEQIHIPAFGESVRPALSGAEADKGVDAQINLNTATLDDLITLDGIGEATAQKIIDDREKHGPFVSIEDIKRVSGIGDKKFEAIADDICV